MSVFVQTKTHMTTKLVLTHAFKTSVGLNNPTQTVDFNLSVLNWLSSPCLTSHTQPISDAKNFGMEFAYLLSDSQRGMP